MQRHTEPGQGGRRRLHKAWISGLAFLAVGAVAGGIASTAISASATTTATATTGNAGSGGTSPPANTGTGTGTAPGGGPPARGAPPGGAALPLHGTVTAVGASSVTIKTSSGTTTYPVTDSSAIEKNGKTTVSALAVGDTVAFSTVTTDGTSAIDKLVAGTMAGGCLHGAAQGTGPGAGPGPPPAGSSAATGSSGSTGTGSSTPSGSTSSGASA